MSTSLTNVPEYLKRICHSSSSHKTSFFFLYSFSFIFYENRMRKNYLKCFADVNSTEKNQATMKKKIYIYAIFLLRKELKNARRVPKCGVICTCNLQMHEVPLNGWLHNIILYIYISNK